MKPKLRASRGALSVALALTISTAVGGCDFDVLDVFGGSTESARENAPAVLHLDPEQSKLRFQILRATAPHNARFEKFDAVMVLSRGTPVSLGVEVAAESLTSDHAELTRHMNSEALLSTAEFPSAHFTSRTISELGAVAKDSPEGSPTHQIDGTLRLRGVSKDVSFPGTFAITDAGVVTTAELPIRPSDYGMSSEEMEPEMVLDEVVLVIDLHFLMPKAPATD